MFDPLANATYAAAFLKQQYQRTGSWAAAAAAYHSATPVYATRYRKRFEAILATLDATGAPVVSATETPNAPAPKRPERENGYPLLQSPVRGRTPGASLVFLAQAGKSTPLLSPATGRLFRP